MWPCCPFSGSDVVRVVQSYAHLGARVAAGLAAGLGTGGPGDGRGGGRRCVGPGLGGPPSPGRGSGRLGGGCGAREASARGWHLAPPECRPAQVPGGGGGPAAAAGGWQDFRVPPCAALLAAHRLQYAARAAKWAPRQLQALIRSPSGAAWRLEVAGAAALARTVLAPRLDELPAPEGGPEMLRWPESWLEWPGPWAAMVSLFLRKAAGDQLAGVLAPGGAWQIPPSLEAAEDDACVCERCKFVAASKQALAVHEARQHGFRRPGRDVADGSVCQWAAWPAV